MKRYLILLCLVACMVFSALITSCGPPPSELARGDISAESPQVVEGGVRFVFFAVKADKVNIVGDFNNWSTSADPMYDREGKGLWAIVLPLAPGRYEYKFLVDGEKWTPDPRNSNRVKDGFGAFNSFVEVNP
jgi:1,4-alpha-glucan branching enzyme